MLQVASDDIINNTGITLANPTGVAGRYLLDFKASSIESSAASVYSGGAATMVITSTGEVRGWGYNLTGGINPNASPLQANYNGQDTVVISGVKQLACGSASSLYTMALLNNGDLVGWGANPYHNANPDSATNPWLDETYVILSGVAKVSCGSKHTMVVMTDGTLRGWGSNSRRQVNPTSATTPWTDKTAVILSNVADVSCGGEHTMVLMEDGTVRAWGSNSEKQSNPLSTEKLWTDVNNIVVSNAKKIAAGAYQSYVIKNDDTLVDWGTNYYKSCNPQSALPNWVDPTITILSDVKDVSGVQQGVIVLHNNGDVVGFGGNLTRGIYPYSSTHPWTDKTAVIISGVSKLVKGYTSNSKVVLSDGSVRGWGSNDYNNLKVDSSVNPWTDPTIELYNVGVPSATLSWGGGTAQPVTEDGVYTLSDGSNTIEATVDYSALSAEDEADNVRVFEELLSISVNPPSKYIRPGDALQYSVIGNYELGVTRDITSQVTDWESSDTSIATMLSSGIAKAVATGKTTINAVLGALSDTVLLMVRSVLPRPPQIVAFSSQKAYRSAEYLTKRFKFPKTSLSLVKVIASAYPVELDVVYPKLSKTLTVVVTSKRPKRIKSFLVDCCEVRIRTNSQVSAVFLASSMDELPL